MREGLNPVKAAPSLPSFSRHRVIVPIYIPDGTGYFKQALEILRLCLESLRLTAGGKASITLVSNASTAEVVHELKRQYDEGWIDQLVLNQRNWGKVDAIVSAARMSYEELVTFSDCDVLFKPGWIEAAEELFHAFPECGFASTTPNPTLAWYCTSATVLGGLVRREISYERVVSNGDLDRFAHSIARPELFKAKHRRSQLVVKRNGITACVGAGHFICTLRRQVISRMPKDPSLNAYKGAEKIWLDQPADRLGFWRLATPKSYTYHMGNVPEPWMYEEVEQSRRSCESLASRPPELPRVRCARIGKIPWRWRSRLISRLSKSSFEAWISGNRSVERKMEEVADVSG